MEEKKGKKSTGLIIVLIIIILCLVGFIIYDKVLNNKPVPVENESVENSAKIEDITNSELADELHDMLTVEDDAGLYYKEKVTTDKTDDSRFIAFALASYIDEYDVKLQNNICGAPSDDINTYISKDDLNNYINNTFNNTLKYDLPLFDESNPDGNIYKLYDMYTFESYEGKWAVTCNGDMTGEVDSKLIKAEKDGDYIYIYDNAVVCSTNGAGYSCNKYIGDTESILNCDLCTENNSDCKHDDICPNRTSDDYEETMAEYMLDNESDKLATFKHTFKESNGKYYLISSEVEKN